MSFALNHEALPSELWLEIFAHLNERSYTTSYTPFQPLPGVGSEGDVKSAYTTVVLVCRNWHDWAISSLYRNLKIPDSHSMWTRNHPEYGRWVRRAILPSSLTLFASQASLSVEILGLCPNIEVLIRPQLSQFRFEFDPLCLQLPSLKRLEWWNGFNSLLSVLSAAPNLEYLFVGLAGFQAVNSIPAHAPDIHLPSLRILRLVNGTGAVSRYFDLAISKWSLPALDTLVVNGRMSLNQVWTSHGSRLRVVELSKLPISCLHGCLTLCELNYHFHDSLIQRGDLTSLPVVTVGCHMASISLSWSGYVERHFLRVGLRCPNLEHLRIYEPPATLLSDVRFPAMLQRLSNRGGYIVEIIDENGLVVSTYRPES